ncbi:MAG: DUF1015 domain-containing protein [Clostridia bacterium]|nr:DUF1015 domain-containing protein [Clostridia bacterium]
MSPDKRRELRFPCVAPSEILIPGPDVRPETWAVIACDQYTSQPDYWERVEAKVGSNPSALRLVLPEIYLGKEEEIRRKGILESMKDVLDRHLLVGPSDEVVPPGFVLTERTTASGVRVGLVAALDLETYDYRSNRLPVRATEQTVPERLPPRIRIRSEALLELPHVLLLTDDPEDLFLGPLYENLRTRQAPDYDFELMENGGHLRGWRIWSDRDLAGIASALETLERSSGGLLFAVGDGNHSLAAAKACWEERKAAGADPETDGFRYALAEMVNLHADAIRFAPIHRFLRNTDAAGLALSFRNDLKSEGFLPVPGQAFRFVSNGRVVDSFSAIPDENADEGRGGLLPVQLLQPFLDGFLSERSLPASSLDYIHGDEALLSLTMEPGTAGILLEPMRKEDLFPGIRAGGCLPRKSFSMGEADEKRFYFEARRLTG